MDTSKTYIKMCEKAEEIQRQWNIAIGDYYLLPFISPEPHIHIVCCHSNLEYLKENLDGRIWLPRQDQLQEMIGYRGLPYLLTQAFERSINGRDCNYTWDNGKHFTSMEQLWLAFVMKEKYNKIWDGEKWE